MKNIKKHFLTPTIPHKDNSQSSSSIHNLQLLQDITMLTEQNNMLKKEIISLRKQLTEKQRNINNNISLVWSLQTIKQFYNKMIFNFQTKILNSLKENEKRVVGLYSVLENFKHCQKQYFKNIHKQNNEKDTQNQEENIISYIKQLNQKVTVRDKKIIELEQLKTVKKNQYQNFIKDFQKLKQYLENINIQQQQLNISDKIQSHRRYYTEQFQQNTPLKSQKVMEIQVLRTDITTMKKLITSASQRIASVIS